MSEINFQPIFDYVDKALEIALDEQKEGLVALMDERFFVVNTQIANLATEVKDMRQEMYASNHRHDRVATWAPKVGDKTGIPFEF